MQHHIDFNRVLPYDDNLDDDHQHIHPTVHFSMSAIVPTRDELASMYLDQLPYEPYSVQEEALLSWFTTDQGVLVCAPTGTGKTLIAEAALFEALHARKIAYYTTPLIALTEQKFQEMQEAAVRWGFNADDVGLVTGNRRVNPDACVLVVVAEILLNRLLHPAAFDFSDVSVVVMDEFHSFNEPERGIVWELSLGLLLQHVRLLLLSATVGNAAEFVRWLNHCHGRRIELVQSTDRKVPLSYQWVPNQLLNEQLELMADGDETTRRTPALVFCFNREYCWSVAEQLKGKRLLRPGQRKKLIEEIEKYDWSKGVGPKLKTILLRGVGVHHAGLLQKYKRIVEYLFQKKLLSVVVCTETLASGINLPARSVVLTELLKGPFGKKKLIDASSAHQIFGRAGRPQYDDRGFVYALAHEDDVKIRRWKDKFEAIPGDAKDPLLIKAKKAMKRKMPTRRKNEQYWNDTQFEKLRTAPSTKLESKGQLPWRLLAYLLSISPEVDRLRQFVSRRLLDAKKLEHAQQALDRMLITLCAGGFVALDPEPPPSPKNECDSMPQNGRQPVSGTLAILLSEANVKLASPDSSYAQSSAGSGFESEIQDDYRPMLATPTPQLQTLLKFRSVNPIYGAFLLQHLGHADRDERIQAFESVLEFPRAAIHPLRVPGREELSPGPLAIEFLNSELLRRGLATADELDGPDDESDYDHRDRPRILSLAFKLRLLFDAKFPDVKDVRTQSIWAAGELLRFGGDFNKLVTSRKLVKQEGLLFRHILRMILLLGEFSELTPPDAEADQWHNELQDISDQLTASCSNVDPDSTDKIIESVHASDIVERDSHNRDGTMPETDTPIEFEDFGVGILD